MHAQSLKAVTSSQQHRIKLTTRGRYAIIAMVEIARNADGIPVALNDVAQRSQVSLSYLEQLFAGLRKHGLVCSYRGPGGGFVLASHPGDITIADIAQAAEDSTPARRISVSTTGVLGDDHPANMLFAFIERFMHDNLRQITLHDVINGTLD